MLIFTKKPVITKKVGIIKDRMPLFANGYTLPKFTICTRITKTIKIALKKSISLLYFIWKTTILYPESREWI